MYWRMIWYAMCEFSPSSPLRNPHFVCKKTARSYYHWNQYPFFCILSCIHVIFLITSDYTREIDRNWLRLYSSSFSLFNSCWFVDAVYVCMCSKWSFGYILTKNTLKCQRLYDQYILTLSKQNISHFYYYERFSPVALLFHAMLRLKNHIRKV